MMHCAIIITVEVCTLVFLYAFLNLLFSQAATSEQYYKKA